MPGLQYKNNFAQRRYLWRFLPTMAVYSLVFVGADWLFHHRQISTAVAVALAVVTALPILVSLVVVGLYLAEEQDEFVRMLFVRSILWGIGGTLAFTSIVGFLETFGVVHSFPIFDVYPLFWMLVGFAQGVQSWLTRGAE